jgi:bla regulator protein blaR1
MSGRIRTRWQLAGAVLALVLASGAAVAGKVSNHIEIHGNISDAPDQAYVLVRDGTESVSGSGDMEDYAAARALRDRYHGDFLWFRLGSDTWVTQDAGLLDRTIEAMKPVEEIGRRQGEIGGRQGEIGRLQGEVGRLQGRLGAEQGRLAAREARLVASDSDDEQERRAIARRHDEIGEQMRQLGEQMERLGRRMEPLGRQQAELGEQQARASLHLKEMMDRLLREAVDGGRARRVER